MKVAIGFDHAGVPLRETVIGTLGDEGHDVIDCGVEDDYPDIVMPVCRAVVEGKAQRGLLVCGSGAGVGVAATKIDGIRAQTTDDTYTAHQSVEHDDLNVLCLGARVVGPELAAESDPRLGRRRVQRRAAPPAAARQGRGDRARRARRRVGRHHRLTRLTVTATAAEATDLAAERIAAAIARGRPSQIALAGGNTPRATYERLAQDRRGTGTAASCGSATSAWSIPTTPRRTCA